MSLFSYFVKTWREEEDIGVLLGVLWRGPGDPGAQHPEKILFRELKPIPFDLIVHMFFLGEHGLPRQILNSQCHWR